MKNKGKRGRSCNRTICQKPHAYFYNHSTRLYYCQDCAMLLNEDNRWDARKLFGHDLCTITDDDREKLRDIVIGNIN